MKLLRLSSPDFEQAVLALPKRGLRDEMLEMVREVLVDGRAQAEVAEKYGKERSQINFAVNKVRKAYLEMASSKSIVSVSLEIPGHLAQELAKLSEQIKSKDIDVVNAALQRVIVDLRAATQRLK